MSSELIVVTFFGIAILLCLISSVMNNIKMQKWAFKKIIKRCFRQGNDFERRMFLKIITETMAKYYTEDNWYSRMYWLVEEILVADDEFGSNLFAEDYNGECIKRGLADSVDSAIKRKGIERT